ncbi:HD domain-containing protein [Nitratiruptor sp. YY09-18]|uniref:[protein-PII] uridylyltransferase family protein n=1 Tax=Nitratiruptor sp. YY09-18 TaxID=2724901 RepID=UPI001915F377|nr:HD domain-containing protein [Nitratiruptor sp. YY09-18]BCD68358.1 [protein-PII] uridylyltransferase [Nitratiruptor sp. YY09-18]
MDIKLQIEELLDTGASDHEISKRVKSTIQDYFHHLEEVFDQTQGKDFLVKHTKYIDSLIQIIFRVAIRKLFGIYAPLSNTIPITLVALGSYGREQLAPYSDIDLMIVYEDVKGFNTKEIIEKVLYIIWDTGLKLGHRVHKIGELQEVANSDNTIKTALIESRYIVGSKYLWFKIESELGKIRHTNQKEFIFQKMQEAENRRKKYPLNMQPYIKEGVGGLRDSNLLYWIANVLYGVRSLKDLQGKLFSEEEYKEYRVALEWLFRLRSALHLVAKKKEDRLLFEYIPELVQKLDVKGATSQKKQQNLMTKTFQAMHTIDQFSQIFTKKMVGKFLFNPQNFTLLKNRRVADGVYLCDEKFYASFQCRSHPLKKLLEVVINNAFNASDPSFVYYSSKSKSSKILSQSNAKLVKKLFYKEKLYPALKLLHQSKLLPVVVPPMKKVMHMPQFDGYHQFPVDLHSIACVEALENIKDPFLQELYQTLSSDEKAMLKLITLLHDSGKGRRQRHHEVGAKLLKSYAQKLGFAQELIETGAILIKHHTDMTETAYNKDIHSEKVVLSFVAPLKTKKRLDMLYLLTYADVNGVGKNVYSSYNAKLLRDLYNLSLEALANEKILDEVSRRLRKENTLKRHKDFQALPKLLQRKILSIESNLFFIRHTSSEIIDIAKRAYETQKYSYHIWNDEYLKIEIIRQVPINLGYLLGKLSYLDVASMEVFKLFDERKYFRIEFLETDEQNIDYIRQVIENSFDMSKKIKLSKPIIDQSGIKIECNHSKTYAMMSLEAPNQKGLLAYVSKIFDEFGIDIATAKINTIRNKAKDLFLIEKNGKFCSKKEEILEKLVGVN